MNTGDCYKGALRTRIKENGLNCLPIYLTLSIHLIECHIFIRDTIFSCCLYSLNFSTTQYRGSQSNCTISDTHWDQFYRMPVNLLTFLVCKEAGENSHQHLLPPYHWHPCIKRVFTEVTGSGILYYLLPIIHLSSQVVSGSVHICAFRNLHFRFQQI